MILLTGIPSEPPTAMAIHAAEQEGIPYVLLNQRESPHSDIVITNGSGSVDGTLRVKEAEYRLSNFAGVYVRLMDHRELPEARDSGVLRRDPDGITKCFVFHELLLDWLEIAPCRVMNRGSDMASNVSKPYQAQLISQTGFLVPETIVTNDVDAVRSFKQRHGRVVFKSISSVRSIVRELTGVHVGDLRNLRNLPTQFQALVPGTDVRVHVVGEAVFATEVASEAVDYRYANVDDEEVDMRAIDLCPEIKSRCLQLAQLLRLPFCGIDLRRTPNGEYYCFEANPSPGYSYYQQNTGQDIAKAIVNYLEHGRAERSRDPMKMQIVENWSEIEGRITGVNAADRPAYYSVSIAASSVQDVPGFTNLLVGREGEELSVYMPKNLVDDAGLQQGRGIRCRVRKAPRQQLFVHRQYLTVLPVEDQATKDK